MKRCPECDSVFPDTDKFCELDGTQLVADHSDSLAEPSIDADEGAEPVVPGRAEPLEWETDSQEELAGQGGYQRSNDAQPAQNWKILSIVAVAGLAIGAVLFVVYQRITREAPEQSSNELSNVAVMQPPAPLQPPRPSPSASASPSSEPSPSPTAMPSPTARTEPARIALSSSPVSTGADGKAMRGLVKIRLTDGTSVEAEEVWETGEGIWYRRRGVVALLERNQVKAIEKPSPAPSPSATPSTSPSASP